MQSPFRPMTDPELRLVDDDLMVERALSDVEAFGAIYERYSTQVFRMCLRAVGNADLADDLTAKAFITVLEKLHQYRPQAGSTFRSWLFVVTRNTVRDHWRRANRTSPIPESGWEPIDDSHGPEELALQRITLEELRDVLATLNDRHRSIVEFRLAGLTTPEIAAAMDMTIPALESAQTRAYAAIRKQYAEKGAAQ